MEEERWTKIDFLSLHYEVSDHGGFRRKLKSGEYKYPKCSRPHGYRSFMARDLYGNRISCRLHRIVAMYFLPTPEPHRKHINHINSNRCDNHYKNLEWCTVSENVIHSYKMGRKVISFKIALIDTKTGRVYDSIKECAESINMKFDTLRSKLNRNHKDVSHLMKMNKQFKKTL